MTIKYSDMFDFWLRKYGTIIIEQSNYLEFVSFHSWRDMDSLLSTPTVYTVAIWTVKTKVL